MTQGKPDTIENDAEIFRVMDQLRRYSCQAHGLDTEAGCVACEAPKDMRDALAAINELTKQRDHHASTIFIQTAQIESLPAQLAARDAEIARLREQLAEANRHADEYFAGIEWLLDDERNLIPTDDLPLTIAKMQQWIAAQGVPQSAIDAALTDTPTAGETT